MRGALSPLTQIRLHGVVLVGFVDKEIATFFFLHAATCLGLAGKRTYPQHCRKEIMKMEPRIKRTCVFTLLYNSEQTVLMY
jgi:hypothetical protein